jgi:hypothetical protein
MYYILYLGSTHVLTYDHHLMWSYHLCIQLTTRINAQIKLNASKVINLSLLITIIHTLTRGPNVILGSVLYKLNLMPQDPWILRHITSSNT